MLVLLQLQFHLLLWSSLGTGWASTTTSNSQSLLAICPKLLGFGSNSSHLVQWSIIMTMNKLNSSDSDSHTNFNLVGTPAPSNERKEQWSKLPLLRLLEDQADHLLSRILGALHVLRGDISSLQYCNWWQTLKGPRASWETAVWIQSHQSWILVTVC